jgi:hypothetical protein
VQRTTFDLLDSMNIDVVAHNSATLPIVATFRGPIQHGIAVLSGDRVVGHGAVLGSKAARYGIAKASESSPERGSPSAVMQCSNQAAPGFFITRWAPFE